MRNHLAFSLKGRYPARSIFPYAKIPPSSPLLLHTLQEKYHRAIHPFSYMVFLLRFLHHLPRTSNKITEIMMHTCQFFLLTNKIFIHRMGCNYKIVNTLSIVTGDYIYLVGLK